MPVCALGSARRCQDVRVFGGKDVALALGYKKPLDAIAHHVESDDSVKHGLLDNRGCKQRWSDGQLIIRAIIHLPRILSFRRPV